MAGSDCLLSALSHIIVLPASGPVCVMALEEHKTISQPHNQRKFAKQILRLKFVLDFFVNCLMQQLIEGWCTHTKHMKIRHIFKTTYISTDLLVFFRVNEEKLLHSSLLRSSNINLKRVHTKRYRAHKDIYVSIKETEIMVGK